MRAQLRFPVKAEVREDLLINHLVSVNEELWLSVGCAVHRDWMSDSIDYLSHLDVLEPIEFAVLQNRQLEAIDTRTVNISVRDRDLFAAQRQLATGLPEYGQKFMADINAPMVVEGLAEKLKTPQIYS